MKRAFIPEEGGQGLQVEITNSSMLYLLTEKAPRFSAAADDLRVGCTSTVWLESSMQSLATTTTTLTETKTVTETISVIP